MFDLYRGYVGAMGMDLRARNIQTSKDDLRKYAAASPDYQPDALRNGISQPMLFTRGGEDHSYNITCMPDDELFAGDIIDVFGQKWLVMEARADTTTHKTGKMTQCNHCFRFQNFTPDIVEHWGIIDQSGYSSTVTGTNQMQKSEEQVAIYLPYNADTAKIFVDKRLASHVGYDQTGRLILNTYKVTSASPNSHSFNTCDHLLVLKAVRDVYSESNDNLELQICDYIPREESSTTPETPETPDVSLLKCSIVGSTSILLSRSKTLTAVFYQDDCCTTAEGVVAQWSYPGIEGLTFMPNGNELVIKASSASSLIGTTFEVTLSDMAGAYQPETVVVEVRNFV